MDDPEKLYTFVESEGDGNSGNHIWRKWIYTDLPLIKPQGFLSFVHPLGWRKPESGKNKGLFKMMAHDSTLLYIEMHDINDGFKTFNAGTRYVIKKIKNIDHESNVKDISGKMHQLKMEDFAWLPNSDSIQYNFKTACI